MEALELEDGVKMERQPVSSLSWIAKVVPVAGVVALSLFLLVEHRPTKNVAQRFNLVAASASDFEEWQGFLGTGDDILEEATEMAMTIKEARDMCAETPACAGFTFEGHRSEDERGTIMFKNQWHFGQSNSWTSFKKASLDMTPRESYNYEHHAGYLGTGDDIDQGEMSVIEAKRHCSELPDCVGFTLEGVRADNEQGLVLFKNDWNFGESDSWSSFKKASPVDFQHFAGFLGEGDDLENGTMTLAQAKDRCKKLPECVGLTFEGQRGDDEEGMVYLKDDWCFGQSDSWTSLKKVPAQELEAAQQSPPAIKDPPSPPAGFKSKGEETHRPDQHIPSIPYGKPPCGVGLKQVSIEGTEGGAICAPACGTVDKQSHCPQAPASGGAEVQCAVTEDEKMYCALECEHDTQCPRGTFCTIVQYPMGICVYHHDARVTVVRDEPRQGSCRPTRIPHFLVGVLLTLGAVAH